MSDDLLNSAPQAPETPEDVAMMQEYFRGNIQKASATHAQSGKPFTMEDAISAGWQGSATGLASRGKLPDVSLPEDASVAQRLVSKAVGMASDVPEMFAGAVAGGTAGPIAAAAGAFAAPTAIREFLMDRYAKGEYQSGADFANRALPVLLETAKSGVLGAATAGVGAASKLIGTGKIAGYTFDALSPVARTALTAGSEVTAMTTLGAAMEGHFPKAQDFLDNAVLLAGFHGVNAAAGKLRYAYAKYNVRPEKALEIAEQHPELKQALLSNDPPEALDQHLGALKEEEAPQEAAPAEPSPADAAAESYFERLRKDSEKTSPVLAEAAPVGDIHDVFPEGPTPDYRAMDYTQLNSAYVTAVKKGGADVRVIKAEIDRRDAAADALTDFPATAKSDTDVEMRAARIANRVTEEMILDPRKIRRAREIAANRRAKRAGRSGEPETPEIDLKEVTSDGVEYDVSLDEDLTPPPAPDLAPLPDAAALEAAAQTPEIGAALAPEVKAAYDIHSDEDISPKPFDYVAPSPESAQEGAEHLDSKVSREAAPKPRESWGDWWTRIYQATVNKTQKIWQMHKTLGTLDDANPGISAENLNNRRLAAQFLERAPVDLDGKKLDGAEAYTAIIRDVNKVTPIIKGWSPEREFSAWILAKHLDYIHTSNPREVTGFDPEKTRNFARAPEYAAKYQKLLDRRMAFKDAVLKYYADAEMIPHEALQQLRAHDPYHVNLYRDLEAREGGPGGGGQGQVIKERKGSERNVEDPISSDIKDTHTLLRRAELNRVAVQMATLAEPNPENAFLNRAGEQKGTAGKNQIAAYVDGQRILYDAHPVLAESWQSLNRQSTSLLVKILSAPAMLTRAGFTGAMDFSFRHVFRANVLAPILSEHTSIKDPLSVLPFGRLAQGLHMLFDPAKVAEAELHGAMQGGVADLSRETLQGEIFKISKETGLMDRAMNVVRNPLDAFIAASHAVVGTATRATALAEYQAGIRAGKTPAEAAFAARQIGLDYSRTGSSDLMRGLNKVTAFQNAGIQGLDTVARAAIRDPIGTFLKAAIYVGLPTIANWYHNRGDSRVDTAPQWQKDMFWLIPTDKWEETSAEAAAGYPDDLKRQREDGSWAVNNGPTFRLPKPFEPGIFFGSLIERTLDSVIANNPRAWEGFDHALFESLPGSVPTFMQPVLEQWANKSVLTGNPLVSHAAEKLLPEYRYSDYTSETAKYLGAFAGKVPFGERLGLAAPAVVENYIHAWTGTVGMYALQVGDWALQRAGVTNTPPKPLSTLADLPIIKAFVVRHPSAGMAPIEEFHQRYEKAAQTLATMQMLAREGKQRELAQLQGLQWHPKLLEDGITVSGDVDGNPVMPLKLTGINRSLGVLHKAVHQVNLDPTMTPIDKRQLIDGYYYQMSQLAAAGNELARTFEKAVAE